jgi:hypothetical protein
MFQDSLKRFGPLALVACFGSLQAQQPGPVSGSAVLIGRIVDGATGRVVPSAIVTLINASEPSPAMPAAMSAGDRVLTDDDGEFIFSGLVTGVYRLTAARIGYADGEYGRERAALEAVIGVFRHNQLWIAGYTFSHDQLVVNSRALDARPGAVVGTLLRPGVDQWPLLGVHRGR